jgi:lipoate-protein ligase A
MTLHLTPPRTTLAPEAKALQDHLDALALSMIGKRYATLESAEEQICAFHYGSELRSVSHDVVRWLRETM